MATNAEQRGPSLEEILSQYALKATNLDRKCPREIRNEIAVKLNDWKMIGHFLDFSAEKLTSIGLENETQDLCKVALLDTWSKREGEGASYLKLAVALHRRQRRDLVEFLCKEACGGVPAEMGIGTDHRRQQTVSSATVKEAVANRDQTTDLEETFKCPCGECSLMVYLKNGCPKSCIPYLGMPVNLSQGDKQNLKYALNKDTTKLCDSFRDLSDSTCDSLIKRNIKLDRLIRVAINHDKSLQLNSKSVKSMDEAFTVLAKSMSFFNHKLLANIIKKLGDESDKQRMLKYSEEFNHYCKRKVFEIEPGNWAGGESLPEVKGKQLFAVVVSSFMIQTLGDTEIIIETLADILDIQPAALHIHRIDKGSVILVFSVPNYIADEIFPLSRNKISQLKAKGIMIFVPSSLNPENSQPFYDNPSVSPPGGAVEDVIAFKPVISESRLQPLPFTSRPQSPISDKKQLFEEKQKFQAEVEDELKVKDQSTNKSEYLTLEDKLVEVNIAEEMLSKEESLLKQQAEKLDQIHFENKQLTIAKTELEAEAGNWEAKTECLASNVDEHDSLIFSTRQEIARLLVEKAINAAKMTFTQQSYEERLEALRREHSSAMETVNLQSKELQNTLESICEKESQIDWLTSQTAILTQEKEQMRVEMNLLKDRYRQQFQTLADAEQTRLLNNEKLKLTLKTEIELLKSKLNSVNDEKHKLEDKMLNLMAEKAESTSAFQAVPQNKQVEQLKKQIAALQAESKHHRKFNQQEASNRVQLVDLQTRLVSLEVENKRLREAARNSTDAIDATASLQKQVSEMSRKTFFLESEKKSLMEKVHSMQTSLKLARDTKDRTVTDRMLKLQEQNQVLQERIRSLEGTFTTKLMAADQKIVSTVKENDILRQRLLEVQETIANQQQQSTALTTLIESLKSESELLTRMKANLESSRADLERLESKQERVHAVQTEIQQFLTASRSTTPIPSYLSSLQGSKRSVSPSDSRPLSPSAFVIQEKLSQMQTASCEFADGLEKHQRVLKEQESELEQFKERFAAIIARLQEASKLSSEAMLLDPKASMEGIELKPDQVQTIAILQKQNEKLQDQVIDRDVALQDIELQMKKDYEMHDRKFALLKSQVLGLREQLSDKNDQLRAKDQYIQQSEERCLEAQKQLFKADKEMERILKKRDQLTKGMPENLQLQGVTNVADALTVQGQELYRLRKDFIFEVTQLQAKLDSVHKEKNVLQSKLIKMERNHIQMKEAMSADINYLRKLNLQLVEQHMKAEKVTEILREVKGDQEAFRKQRDLHKLEAELESSNLKVHEQDQTISVLEHQVASQALTIKLLQARMQLYCDDARYQETDLSDWSTTSGMSLSGPALVTDDEYSSTHLEEDASKPRETVLSDWSTTSGYASSSGSWLVTDDEYSSTLFKKNTSKPQQGKKFRMRGHRRTGSIGSNMLPFIKEKEPEDNGANMMLSLVPMVVTDDEYSSTVHEEKATKPQQVQKLQMRGHHTYDTYGTASTRSNMLSYVEPVHNQHATLPPSHPLSSKQKPIPKYPRRPGSAGSTRPDVDVAQVSEVKSPDQIMQSAQALSEYINNDLSKEESEFSIPFPVQNSSVGARVDILNLEEQPEDSGSNMMLSLGPMVVTDDEYSSTLHEEKATKPQRVQKLRMRGHHRTASTGSNVLPYMYVKEKESVHNQHATFATLLPSHPPSSKQKPIPKYPRSTGSMRSDIDIAQVPEVKSPHPIVERVQVLSSAFSAARSDSILDEQSMSSSCSTLFSGYDGGESSSTYSHESLEIGEYLQALTKLGYSKHDTTTSSSDEDTSHHNYGRLGRRKRSSGATNTDQSHDTPRHKD